MSATSLPDGRAGQALAAGITLVLLLAAWFALAAPLLDTYANGAERLEQRRTLARRMEEVAATLPRLRQAETAGAVTGPAAATLLDGASDAVAAASLQERVRTMASKAGATLTSAETLPATQAGAYRRIGLRVALQAPWSVLVHLLQSIEEASPRMLADDIQVHATRLVGGPPDPALDAGLTVLAFRAGSPPP